MENSIGEGAMDMENRQMKQGLGADSQTTSSPASSPKSKTFHIEREPHGEASSPALPTLQPSEVLQSLLTPFPPIHLHYVIIMLQ